MPSTAAAFARLQVHMSRRRGTLALLVVARPDPMSNLSLTLTRAPTLTAILILTSTYTLT